MAEPITISRNTPALKSMDYKFLKAEGIARIQELAGKIWTDYNEHDPGVTLLEALCYAITDLGYRTSFDMKDLLAPNPADEKTDSYNFFTARQILHNNPVTIQDYRKLLMDVSVLADSTDEDSEIIGIKNAWITVANHPEFNVFVNREENQLSYQPPKIGSKDPLDIKVLYDVILEFSDSTLFGDLNLDTQEADYEAFCTEVVDLILGREVEVQEGLPDYDQHLYDRIKAMTAEEFKELQEQATDVLDLIIKVKIEFPRWDEADLNWNNILAIKQAVKQVKLTFINLPEDLEIKYKLDQANNILLASVQNETKDRPVPLIDDITNRLNCLVMGQLDSLLLTYQKKVLKILEILTKAKARLNVHRNLCEDFYRFKALKVEEILVCADIELETDANIEETEGHIYFLLDRFLTPTVNFYSLSDILTKDQDEKKYQVVSINKQDKKFVISGKVKQALQPGDKISWSEVGAEVVEFTVVSVLENALQKTNTDLEVEENLGSIRETVGSFLFAGRLSEEKLRPSEQIFEGPRLENGFVDDDELKIADRKTFINASDLINLIMDVPGVVAVKQLQVANFPQDENPEVLSRSVRWCLKLAVDKDYVPRLSISKSKFTFFKDELPFEANKLEAEGEFKKMKSEQRPQKQPRPVLDLEVPVGEYRYLSEYTSVQEDLPLTYGVGKEGVPVDDIDDDEITERRAKARQLKGFLMVFDQLLANYLVQLDHLKDLFSFNPERKDQLSPSDMLPEEYNFQVDKTYFSQPLYSEMQEDNIVPNAEELYINYDEDKSREENVAAHKIALQAVTEDQDTFVKRRNKFLDHLIARFAEQFTDYALLAYKLEGPKSELELIEDKQDFLSIYPELSANRGRAFDYKKQVYWHPDNRSGLEKRTSFLTGIDPAEPLDLFFDPKVFLIVGGDGQPYSFKIHQEENILLDEYLSYPSFEELNLALEKIIVCGTYEDNYVYECRKINGKGWYTLYLYCEGEIVAWKKDAYETKVQVTAAIAELLTLFRNEFFENPLSNRNNFSLPFDNYFVSDISDEDIDESARSYKISFRLFATPFHFEEDKLLLHGVLEGQIESKDTDSLDEIKSAARLAVRDTYWQLVYLGKEPYRYSLREYGLSVTNRLGDEIARGEVDQINLALQYLEVDTVDKTDFEVAVARLNVFLGKTFFRQEGVHLLEHILLRPRVNDLWVAVQPDMLRDIPEKDTFIPIDYLFPATIQVTNGTIRLEGDFTGQLRYHQKITLISDMLTETYQVDSFEKEFEKEEDGEQVFTVLTTEQTLAAAFSEASELQMSYQQAVRIVNILEEQLLIVLEKGADLSPVQSGTEIRITGPKGKISYGEYHVGEVIVTVEDDSEPPAILINEFKVQDRLLPIYLPNSTDEIEGPEDCDACKVYNPYSYIAQVAVPAWPGRFDNIDFRNFFERKMRMEAPAHVFLNICWIGYDHMELFERRYKLWLLENLAPFPKKPYDDSDKEKLRALSKAQNELVEVLGELRNVYPVKSLHDCDESESTEGAIILNRTALGEI